MTEAATTPISEADLASVTRSRAQAEAAEWAAMLDFFDTAEQGLRSEEHLPAFHRETALSMITFDIGQAMGLSEAQVSYRLAAARRVRDLTPTVWDAFGNGRVDAARVREIAGAVEKLERPASITRLDSRVVTYAESHTVAELRRWLKLFVAGVESDRFAARAEAERANRRVEIVHGDDGMSWLNAYGESFVLAAIDKRLTCGRLLSSVTASAKHPAVASRPVFATSITACRTTTAVLQRESTSARIAVATLPQALRAGGTPSAGGSDCSPSLRPANAPPGRSLNTPLWSAGPRGTSREYHLIRLLRAA